MQNANEFHNLIATALIGVVNQIKAIRYYPDKHPALQATAEESLRGFEPVLADNKHLLLTVRKEGFLFNDNQIAKSSQILVQLANFCFARRIQHLTFLADLNSSDLHHFVHYLLLDPLIIQRQGGIQSILEKARLTTIWTNVRDLDDVLKRRKTIESLPMNADFDPAAVLTKTDDAQDAQAHIDAASLEKLLEKMEREENDARFQHFLQELVPLLRLQLIGERRALVLRAFLLLCRCATDKRFSQERTENALQALDQLATKEMTDFLAAYMLAANSDQKTRDTLVQILAFLGNKVANQLMDLLANERTASKRKLLYKVMVRNGATVLPVIYEYLDDERWYVTRNAIAILGDIRSQDSLQHLTPLLQHEEIRVRRETIRALTKIGGNRAIKILLQTAAADDQELCRQAILSLGAIRTPSAVPTLLKLLQKSDWSQRAVDLKKDAIRALGEIRDPKAIPELVKIIKSKSWLRRQLNNELRMAAAAALGDISDQSTRNTLEKATHDRTAAVARAAAQALKQLDKAIV
ncbi:MAG: HEAT repeat domain-containing protein [Desulfuromonadales bacterium]